VGPPPAREAAPISGINRTYVSKLEKDESCPGREIVAKLAAVVGVELAKLRSVPSGKPNAWLQLRFFRTAPDNSRAIRLAQII
jgi:hypothetical protein